MRLLACVGIKQQFVTPCVSVGRHVVVCRLCTLTHYHTVGSWLRHRPENNNKAFTILNTNQNRIVNDVQFSVSKSCAVSRYVMLVLPRATGPFRACVLPLREKKKEPKQPTVSEQLSRLIGKQVFFLYKSIDQMES